MPRSDSFRRILSQFSFPTLRYKLALGASVLFLAGYSCLAQEIGNVPELPSDQNKVQTAPVTPQPSTVTIPAGTRIALVLTYPIRSRYIHRGDDIYAQISSAVTSGRQVVIPPGTLVQGRVDKLARKNERAELQLQSMSISFPDGYVAPVAGPVTLEIDEGYALKDPGRGRMVGAMALPAAGAGLGALIGHAAGGNGTNINGINFNPGGVKSTAIGGMVGLAAGEIASLLMNTSSHNFYLDVGSPVEMVLHQPLSLDQGRPPTPSALRATPTSKHLMTGERE